MKSSDITVILNGIGTVARAFVNLHSTEINKVWKNSSFHSISKSTATLLEEKISSSLTQTNKTENCMKVATEVQDRASVVILSMRAYCDILAKQNITAKVDNNEHFDLNHPIITTDLYSVNTVEKFHTRENVDDLKSEILPPVDPDNVMVNKDLGGLDKDASTTTTVHIPKVSTVPHPVFEEKRKLYRKKELQKLSDRAKERKVPSSQLGRIMSYGGLAAGMGIGAAVEMARRKLGLTAIKQPVVQSILTENPMLSEANVNRIVDTLCKVRGAALKLGQMLSLQDNSMIDPKLASIFERVRQSADFMPSWQMERVLRNELGSDWKTKFLSFESKPFAAASIGQVHSAKLLDGTDVAIKIQYPGVAQSIKSDIKSLMGIINLWNILPKGMYLENVMAVAERELKKEVDYINEAESAKIFKKLLEPYPEYTVPHVYEDVCTRNVLTTDLVYGSPIDKLQDSEQRIRNMVCERLLRLCLMEVFLFKFMQTDPNWANFLYNHETEQIVLLDFGACNTYTDEFSDTYMNIIKASAERDREKVLTFSQRLGFLTGYETKIMEEAHVEAVMILGEAFACEEPFDFKKQNMTKRIHDLVPIMLKHRLTPPPDETYSLHRKMSGIFLLCTKLGAVIDCRKLFDDVYHSYEQKLKEH